MFCRKCGEQLPDGASICPVCNQPVMMPEAPLQHECAVEMGQQGQAQPGPKSGKKLAVMLSAAMALCLVAVLIVFGIQTSQKAKLQEELLRGWSRVEQGNSGTYYELELDFGKKSVDYNFHSNLAWLDTTIATFDYRVVSGSKIEILDYHKEFEIEINKERTCIKITPSLTDSNAYEFWYHFD